MVFCFFCVRGCYGFVSFACGPAILPQNIQGFLQQNFKAQLLDSVEDMSPEHPAITIYCAGFCCQPWSPEGSMQGFSDPRAQLFWPMLGRIEKYRDSLQCILLENTAALAKDRRNKSDFETILTALRKRLGEFTWDWNICNSCDYGVPQNRRRLFLVGYKTALCQREFAWPKPWQPTPNLEDILEAAPNISKAERSQREEALTTTGKRNLSMAKASIIEAGYDPDTFACCIDIDTGRKECSNYSVGIARTLTRTRGRSGGPWISNRWRRMTLAEMAGLQGVDLTNFDLSNLSEKDIGAMFLGKLRLVSLSLRLQVGCFGQIK